MNHKPYLPEKILRNGHANTILSRIRNPKQLPYTRKRLTTADDDFFDVDFLKKGNRKTAVLFHGLEGSSQAKYIRSLAGELHESGWDIAAVNFRSRSGEVNKQLRVYHAGATDDVACVMDEVIKDYDEVAMIGYSFGGILSMRYCGEQGTQIHPKIKTVIGISTPMDLSRCGKLLDEKFGNKFYQKRFLYKLKNTVKAKAHQYPHIYNKENLNKIKSLEDFDDTFTGPVNGFKDAQDYYKNCSCKDKLKFIKIPALIINAEDDPFLAKENYKEAAYNNKNLTILNPAYGGHCGFSYLSRKGNWADKQVLNFLNHIGT